MNTRMAIKSAAIKFFIMLAGWTWALLCVCVCMCVDNIHNFSSAIMLIEAHWWAEHRITLFYRCVNHAPAATGCCSTCLAQWRYTEMWRSVRRSPPHPQVAGNEGIYLQQRNKWSKLVGNFTDWLTEAKAVSYKDVIKNTQYTGEDTYNSKTNVHYNKILLSYSYWAAAQSSQRNRIHHCVRDWDFQVFKI